MSSSLRLIILLMFFPAILFSQVKEDSSYSTHSRTINPVHRYREDSTFSILVNLSNVFYTAKDSRINNFLNKYGYIAPQNIPVGVNLELAAIPFESRMTFTLSASTIVSKQDIISSEFKLGAFRRLFEREHFWIAAGLALGSHGSRVILDGNMP